MEESVLGRAITFHGPDFLRQLQLEQQQLPPNAFMQLQRHQPQLPEISEPQFILNVRRFIARKADYLFRHPTEENKIKPGSADEEDSFAKMPPLETFMGIDEATSRSHFFQSLEKKDVVVGVVSSVMDSGLVVTLLCLDDNKSRDIDTLSVTAFVPAKEIPRLFPNQNPVESYQVKDKIRGMVLSVNPETEKVIVTLICRLVDDNDQPKSSPSLGLIQEEDFPVQYRRKLHIRGLTFDELLNSILGFNNTGSVPCLLASLGQHHNTSIMRGLSRLKIPEREYADALKKHQSQKLAYQSVAQGITFFKEGRQTEAMQQLNRALQIDGDNVEALVARGALYANNESYSRALEDFQKALKVNPKHANGIRYMHDTLLAKGKSHEDTDDWVNAEKCYQQALTVDTNSKEALDSIKYVKYKQEQKTQQDGDEGIGKEHMKQGSRVPFQTTTDTLKKLIQKDKQTSRKKRKLIDVSPDSSPDRKSRSKRKRSVSEVFHSKSWSRSSSSSSNSSGSSSSSTSSSHSRSPSKGHHSKSKHSYNRSPSKSKRRFQDRHSRASISYSPSPRRGRRRSHSRSQISSNQSPRRRISRSRVRHSRSRQSGSSSPRRCRSVSSSRSSISHGRSPREGRPRSSDDRLKSRSQTSLEKSFDKKTSKESEVLPPKSSYSDMITEKIPCLGDSPEAEKKVTISAVDPRPIGQFNISLTGPVDEPENLQKKTTVFGSGEYNVVDLTERSPHSKPQLLSLVGGDSPWSDNENQKDLTAISSWNESRTISISKCDKSKPKRLSLLPEKQSDNKVPEQKGIDRNHDYEETQDTKRNTDIKQKDADKNRDFNQREGDHSHDNKKRQSDRKYDYRLQDSDELRQDPKKDNNFEQKQENKRKYGVNERQSPDRNRYYEQRQDIDGNRLYGQKQKYKDRSYGYDQLEQTDRDRSYDDKQNYRNHGQDQRRSIDRNDSYDQRRNIDRNRSYDQQQDMDRNRVYEQRQHMDRNHGHDQRQEIDRKNHGYDQGQQHMDRNCGYEQRQDIDRNRDYDQRQEMVRNHGYDRGQHMNRNRGYEQRQDFERNHSYDRSQDIDRTSDYEQRQDMDRSSGYDQEQDMGRKVYDRGQHTERKQSGYGQRQDIDRNRDYDQRQDIDRDRDCDQRQDIDKNHGYDQRQDIDRSGGYDWRQNIDQNRGNQSLDIDRKYGYGQREEMNRNDERQDSDRNDGYDQSQDKDGKERGGSDQKQDLQDRNRNSGYKELKCSKKGDYRYPGESVDTTFGREHDGRSDFKRDCRNSSPPTINPCQQSRSPPYRSSGEMPVKICVSSPRKTLYDDEVYSDTKHGREQTADSPQQHINQSLNRDKQSQSKDQSLPSHLETSAHHQGELQNEDSEAGFDKFAGPDLIKSSPSTDSSKYISHYDRYMDKDNRSMKSQDRSYERHHQIKQRDKRSPVCVYDDSQNSRGSSYEISQKPDVQKYELSQETTEGFTHSSQGSRNKQSPERVQRSQHSVERSDWSLDTSHSRSKSSVERDRSPRSKRSEYDDMQYKHSTGKQSQKNEYYRERHSKELFTNEYENSDHPVKSERGRVNSKSPHVSPNARKHISETLQQLPNKKMLRDDVSPKHEPVRRHYEEIECYSDNADFKQTDVPPILASTGDYVDKVSKLAEQHQPQNDNFSTYVPRSVKMKHSQQKDHSHDPENHSPSMESKMDLDQQYERNYAQDAARGENTFKVERMGRHLDISEKHRKYSRSSVRHFPAESQQSPDCSNQQRQDRKDDISPRKCESLSHSSGVTADLSEAPTYRSIQIKSKPVKTEKRKTDKPHVKYRGSSYSPDRNVSRHSSSPETVSSNMGKDVRNVSKSPERFTSQLPHDKDARSRSPYKYLRKQSHTPEHRGKKGSRFSSSASSRKHDFSAGEHQHEVSRSRSKSPEKWTRTISNVQKKQEIEAGPVSKLLTLEDVFDIPPPTQKAKDDLQTINNSKGANQQVTPVPEVSSRWDSPKEKKSRWEHSDSSNQSSKAILTASDIQKLTQQFSLAPISSSPPPHRKMKPHEKEAMLKKWEKLTHPTINLDQIQFPTKKSPNVENKMTISMLATTEKVLETEGFEKKSAVRKSEKKKKKKKIKVKGLRSKWDSDDSYSSDYVSRSRSRSKEKKDRDKYNDSSDKVYGERKYTKEEKIKRSRQSRSCSHERGEKLSQDEMHAKLNKKDRVRHTSRDVHTDRSHIHEHRSYEHSSNLSDEQYRDEYQSQSVEHTNKSKRRSLPDIVQSAKDTKSDNEMRVYWFHKDAVLRDKPDDKTGTNRGRGGWYRGRSRGRGREWTGQNSNNKGVRYSGAYKSQQNWSFPRSKSREDEKHYEKRQRSRSRSTSRGRDKSPSNVKPKAMFTRAKDVSIEAMRTRKVDPIRSELGENVEESAETKQTKMAQAQLEVKKETTLNQLENFLTQLKQDKKHLLSDETVKPN